MLEHYLEGFKTILDRKLFYLYMLFRTEPFKQIFSSLDKHAAYLFALYHSPLKCIIAFEELRVFSYSDVFYSSSLLTRAEIGVVGLGFFFFVQK